MWLNAMTIFFAMVTIFYVQGSMWCFHVNYGPGNAYCSTQEGAVELGVFTLMENCFIVASKAFSFPEK